MSQNPSVTKLLFGLIAAGLLLLVILGTVDSFSVPDLGFNLDSDFVVTDILPDSTAARSGIEIGDRILRVNGQTLVEGAFILEQGRQMYTGSSITYTIEKSDGKTRDITILMQPPSTIQKVHILANAFTSLFIIGLGVWVILRHPELTTARLFFVLCMVYIFFRMNHPRLQLEVTAQLYQTAYLICFFAIPAIYAHFCAAFPRPTRFLYRKPKRILWLYTFPAILSIPAAIINWLHYTDIQATLVIKKLILIQGFVIWAIYLMAGSLMLVYSFIRVRSRILSLRCVAVFYSLLLALCPYFIAGIFSTIQQNSPGFQIAAQLLFLPFPAALAWAVDLGGDADQGLPWMIGKYLHEKIDPSR